MPERPELMADEGKVKGASGVTHPSLLGVMHFPLYLETPSFPLLRPSRFYHSSAPRPSPSLNPKPTSVSQEGLIITLIYI